MAGTFKIERDFFWKHNCDTPGMFVSAWCCAGLLARSWAHLISMAAKTRTRTPYLFRISI